VFRHRPAVPRLDALTVGALLVIAWAATSLAPLLKVWALGTAVVSVASLIPLIPVAAVPLVTVAVRRRRWVPLVATVLAAAAPWAFVLGYAAPDNPASRSTTGPAMRLMLVCGDHGNVDAQAVVTAVRSQQVDVLVITELTSTLVHTLTAAGLDRMLEARSMQLPTSGTADAMDAGLGVWSRIDVGAAASLTGTHWPAASVVLRPSGGAAVTLLATHVAPPLAAGAVSWADDLAILRHTAAGMDGDAVMLGSLNAMPWHRQFRAFDATGLSDAAEVLGRGLRPTWPTWLPVPVLSVDHALVSRRIGVTSVDTVVVTGSDHRGLLVSLRAAPA
jgi:endonuclease/exonuclease/phosphatase (EEP) superfamily protein YafD